MNPIGLRLLVCSSILALLGLVPEARAAWPTPSVQAAPVLDIQAAKAAVEGAQERLEARESALLLLRGKAAGGPAPKAEELDAARVALEEQATALGAAARDFEEAGGNGAPYRARIEAARQVLGQAPTPSTDQGLSLEGLWKLVPVWTERGLDFLREQGPRLLWQTFVVVSLWALFGFLGRFVKRLMRRALSSPRIKASSLVKDFLSGIASNAVVVIGLLVILTQVGIEIGPLLAGFGVAGFIAGFALQDVLSNFAAGVMILFYRPFDVGDFVRAGGELGTVKEMSLVSTILSTPDNQRLIVPNKKIWGETIQNVTSSPTRRVDLTVAIDYGDDIGKALALLEELVSAHPLTLAEPAPVVRVNKLADSGIEIIVRPWVKSPDYWNLTWDLNRSIKERFDQAGITIPFPQRVVHLRGEAPAQA